MIDVTQIPKTCIEWLSNLCRSDAATISRFDDGLPPPPPDVKDQLLWRLANGTYQPDVPAVRRRREERTVENSQVRLRDFGG
jgi:hypothetical protein